MKDQLSENRISSKTIYSGPIFDVETHDVILPNGKQAKRDIVVNPNAAAIVAIDDQQRIILVRQYRDSAQRIMLEIPAGKMDPGEDAITCARRELREETGYVATNMESLFAMRVSPGFSSEIIHIMLATDLQLGDTDPDEDEFVEVMHMPIEEITAMIMKGDIQDGKTIAGVLGCIQRIRTANNNSK